jgi:hypothetical protein
MLRCLNANWWIQNHVLTKPDEIYKSDKDVPLEVKIEYNGRNLDV